MITQQKLKEMLTYSPETGEFSWKVCGKGIKAGKPVGCVSRGYRLIKVDRVLYTAARLAWLYQTGEFPEHNIDHIDGNSLNNRWENLRDVSQEVNTKNLKRRVTNTSGVTGVSWSKEVHKWDARIGKKRLGFFSSLEEATKVRKQAEKDLGYHPNHGRA